MISLPDYLLQEVDGIVQKENSNRSEFIRQAMKVYLVERKKRHIREMMQRGYMEMAKINLNMASEAFHAEEDADNILGPLSKRGVVIDSKARGCFFCRSVASGRI